MLVNTFIEHTFNKVSMVAAVAHMYAYNMQYLRAENDRVLRGLVVGGTENAAVSRTMLDWANANENFRDERKISAMSNRKVF
jgi:hypothetical protein